MSKDSQENLTKNYRRVWLGIYVLANLIAAIVFGIQGELDGDLIGYPLPSYSVLLLATVAVIASYFIWMGPVYNFIASIKVSSNIEQGKISSFPGEANLMGFFVLATQAAYLIFNLQEGVNVAGSIQTTDSSARYLWYLLVPDAVFLVYYGLYRKSPLFLPNLLLYLASNAARGWFGTWLIVFFIEGAYRLREGRLDWKVLIGSLTIFIAALPILVELKWKIRISIVEGRVPLDEVYAGMLVYVENMDWLRDFSELVRPIVMRFQHLACVIGIIDNANVLAEGLNNREYLYFFEEGIQPIEKLVGIAVAPDVHVALLGFLIPEQLQQNSITNTHVGLVGWFWLSPHLILHYLFYLLFISMLGVWLYKKIAKEELLSDVVWFSWLGYLMNGWFAAYMQFLQALVVVYCVRYLIINFSARFWRNIGVNEKKGKECKQSQ